jgi:hypothetical protein
MEADRVVYEWFLLFYYVMWFFALLIMQAQCSQDSLVSEEEVDVEEKEEKAAPEGARNDGDNGSEKPERKELEVSDAGGTSYLRPSRKFDQNCSPVNKCAHQSIPRL